MQTIDNTLGYRTLHKEVRLEHLPVQGKIPSWLAGSFLRNGPAKFEVGEQRFRHWFDGFAMLHRFTFRDNQVSYENKFVRTEAYKSAMRKGRITFRQFATDPCRAIFKGSMSNMVNPNVSIHKIAGEFVAMTETPLPVAFDPQTLETLGVVRYQDTLKGHHGSAHPHYDHLNQMSISYLTKFGMPSIFQVYSIKDGTHARRLIGSYQVARPSYLHSFGLTKNYIVVVEYPYRVNPLNLLTCRRPFIENYHWQPQEGTTFVVMDKRDGHIVGRYETSAFFTFHHINAFERRNELFIDVSTYDSPQLINEFYLDHLRGEHRSDPEFHIARLREACQLDTAQSYVTHGEFRRYRLSLHKRDVSYEVVTDHSIELPTINYSCYNTHEYRFAYGVSNDSAYPEELSNRLIYVDVANGAVKLWQQPNCYPGEPIFIAAPDACKEDDGVVLSVVLDAKQETSFLLLLDAHNFEEIARAEVPHHIPFGFHGNFFADV